MSLFKNIFVFLIVFILIIVGCTTEKNTFVTRTYHNTTTRYNVFFNGRESFKKGLKNADEQFSDDYTQILPIFKYNEEEFATSLSSNMDGALKKGAKIINFHSITVKPEYKKGTVTEKQREFYAKKEFNKLMDENYLLMGKAHYFKQDYYLAIETFRFILAEFPKEEETILLTNLWLARSYIETSSFDNAEDYLQKIEEVPKKLLSDYNATYAHFWIKQDNYEKAIEYLTLTLNNTKKRQLKTRYTYILAQLYHEIGNEEKAYNLYSKVIKMNPNYEMAFNAKINQALSFYGEGGKDILSELYKMLKDDKNIEYKDQIYYAIANIYYKRKEIDVALENYKLSSESTKENYTQQAISQLAIADIYYERKNFEEAQAYYDSCVTNLDSDFPGYDIILGKSLSLTSLVENLQEYKLQDSLQYLASLDEATLKNVINEIIQDVIEKEQEEKLREQERLRDLSFANSQTGQNQNFTQNSTAGQWYFYNLTAKGLGQNEFKLKWGGRRLEDNWRRKNKTIISTDEFGSTDPDDESDEKSKKLDNKSPEYYLQKIPQNDSMLNASHLKLKESLYNAATIYKNDLKDNEQAKALFLDLVKRYPNDYYTLLSYYALYTISKEENNTAKREYYKQIITQQFPESLHAKIMSDPSYVEEYERMQKEIDFLYDNAYKNYTRGNYLAVKQAYVQAISKDKYHILIPKFEYLNILASKPEKNSLEFRKDLELYIKNYPSESQTQQAKKIIALMDEGTETLIADVQEEELEIYEFTPNEEHYVLLGTKQLKEHNQLSFNVINFNLDNFAKLNLTTDKKEVGNYRLTVIQKFKNQTEAKNYFEQLILNPGVFKDVVEETVIKVIISKTNLETLNVDKSLLKYEKFYQSNYR